MTKPRKSVHRELYGFIGKSSPSVPARAGEAAEVLREWNAHFRREGIDASMDVYPTTQENLPERLSEMFHFDRCGYIVSKDLSRAIIPLLDRVDLAARRRGVGFVWNNAGVLRGCSLLSGSKKGELEWQALKSPFCSC